MGNNIIITGGYIITFGGTLVMLIGGRPANEALLWLIFGMLWMIYCQVKNSK